MTFQFVVVFCTALIITMALQFAWNKKPTFINISGARGSGKTRKLKRWYKVLRWFGVEPLVLTWDAVRARQWRYEYPTVQVVTWSTSCELRHELSAKVVLMDDVVDDISSTELEVFLQRFTVRGGKLLICTTTTTHKESN